MRLAAAVNEAGRNGHSRPFLVWRQWRAALAMVWRAAAAATRSNCGHHGGNGIVAIIDYGDGSVAGGY
jgi:hypothetical protein